VLTTGNRLPTLGTLTYVPWQVTFAISPLIKRNSLARKILLADDSVTAQNMGRKILADAGYEVIAVNNGSAALKKIAELKPDLVVLDVYMPGYSGLEVCQRLKESHETARIPVLLTVGKLEPFKPEEAQRVRAEAFIVKPFEASELLSALSKLEDKVVPRAEPSRPGRFARAFAAVEESGRVRPGEENGWKSRISFPHEKTAEEKKAENSEQPDTYNPINRDLRTIVESPQEKSQEQTHQRDEQEKRETSGRQNETVDVAALAPSSVAISGLPKDVTQEELAAITAAAAQIQAATVAIEAQQGSEVANQVVAPAVSETLETVQTVGFDPPMREIDLETAAPPIVGPPPTVSEGKTAETQDSQAPDSPDSKETKDVPVTMAATADSVASLGEASRWTAVAVPLEGDEAGLLLEHEMQKASVASEVNRPDAASADAVSELAASSEFVIKGAVPKISEQFAEGVSPSHQDSEQQADSVEPVTTPVQEAGIANATPVGHDVSAFEAAEASAAEFAETGQAGAKEFATLQSPESDFSAPVSEDTAGAGYSIAAREAQPEPVAETTEADSGIRAFDLGVSTTSAAIEPHSEVRTEAAPDETVKNTAAAWASWRQSRESGKATESAEESDAPEPAATEANAAAAAAGAGQSLSSPANLDPSENGGSSDVASIVDSVLADLRPKLMKEISRKMAEKK
jgi:CheY-like chemotaxis protein